MTDDEIIDIRKATHTNNVTKPWGDTLAFAHAVLARKKLFGWAILDKGGIYYDFKPLMESFYGSTMEQSPPDAEYFRYLDREYAGCAPHTFKEVFVDCCGIIDE